MREMKNKFKRAFTLVELVIVIAVIGILASILIPTFTNVINSAENSSDLTELKQMNTLLATERIFDNVESYDVDGVKEVLLANNFDLITVNKDNSYWYNRETNQVEIHPTQEFITNTNSKVLKASASGGFVNDVIESLSITKPECVYISENDNLITKELSKIRNYSKHVDIKSASQIVLEGITTIINEFNGNQTLSKFTENTLLVSESGYEKVGEENQIKHVIFEKDTKTVPAVSDTVEIEIKIAIDVVVPSSVKEFSENSFTSKLPKGSVIVASNVEFKGNSKGEAVVDSKSASIIYLDMPEEYLLNDELEIPNNINGISFSDVDNVVAKSSYIDGVITYEIALVVGTRNYKIVNLNIIDKLKVKFSDKISFEDGIFNLNTNLDIVLTPEILQSAYYQGAEIKIDYRTEQNTYRVDMYGNTPIITINDNVVVQNGLSNSIDLHAFETRGSQISQLLNFQNQVDSQEQKTETETKDGETYTTIYTEAKAKSVIIEKVSIIKNNKVLYELTTNK